VVGRYVLTPAIFGHLEKLGHGASGEIQLTDGIAALMREEAVYAYRFSGKRYDCGNKLGYLQATVEYALGHPQLGTRFRKYLEGLDLGAESAKEAGSRRADRNPRTGNGGARARRAATRARARRPERPGTQAARKSPSEPR
ncbi:MAG: hypothetical protein ACRETS_13255, partial [Steroidobacteraceae bacterium]